MTSSTFSSLKSVAIKGGGTHGTLFYRGGFENPPSWVSIFQDVEGFDASKLVNKSTRAILVIKVSKRWFCFTFGYSRHLISDSAIERDFGLIVTLNLGDPEAIKALDKTNISHIALQSREQAGRDISIDGFEFNTEIDLLKSLTAKAPLVDGEEQETFSGRDSISIYTRVEVKTFAEIAKRLLKAFENTAYLDRYPWIGKVVQERDPALVSQLNAAMVEAINSGNDSRIWLAVPEVIAWEETQGFAYKVPPNNPKKAGAIIYPDIDLDTWLSEMKLSGTVTLPRLTDRRIYRIYKDDQYPSSWSVYRCLNAEVDLTDSKYILNDGEWYKIESSYAKEIDDFYKAIPSSQLVLPAFGTKNEPKYLEYLCSVTADTALMDRKLISVGSGKSTVEFCDLFTKSKDIVHVKKYGGSSVLSHLFFQASVSAELFLYEKDFRTKLNTKLPAGYKLADPNPQPVPTDYTICLAIMSKVPGPLEIPFFSKVSMREAVRAIRKMNFKVTKLKIEQS